MYGKLIRFCAGFGLGCLLSSSLTIAQQAAPQPGHAESRTDLSPFSVVQNESGLTLLDGIQPVLTYRASTTSRGGRWPRANYIHPLYGLEGQILTEDFPTDHGHHRGIFWAWHQVLVGSRSAGDAWVCEDFNWDVRSLEAQVKEEQAVVQAKVIWRSPAIIDEHGEMLPIAEERVRIVVHPREAAYRNIDFEIGLLALADEVRIGGSDDVKGYGGFSPRIKLHESVKFRGPSGFVEPQITSVQAGGWMSIEQPGGGLAMLCHRQNPGFPQPWILRSARSMQNAVYPGRHAVSLPSDSPLSLKYRLVIHDGSLPPATIEEIFQQYASAKQ